MMDYAHLVRKPINQLVIIAPLLLLFHVGSVFYGNRLLMPRYIAIALEWFDINWPGVVGIVIIFTLLCQQITSKTRWHVNFGTIFRELLESAAWSLPLVAASWLTSLAYGEILPEVESKKAQLCREILEAVGAGVYEEFVFRLLLIGLILLFFVDIAGLNKLKVSIIAIIFSAVFFSAAHFNEQQLTHLNTPRMCRAAFLVVAGTLWGVLAVWRGYAMAACSHIWWNLLVIITTKL